MKPIIIILMNRHVPTVTQAWITSLKEKAAVPVTFPTAWIVRTILTVFSVMKVITFTQRMVSVCTVTTASMNLLRKETVNHV